MSSSPNDKSRSFRAEKSTAQRKMTLGHSIVVWCATIFVTIVIAVSLWVAVDAIREKARMVRGTGQIFDLVDMARRLAESEHGWGKTDHEDVLLKLAHMQQIEVAIDKGGLVTLTNPWGGALVAYTVAPGTGLKLETVVPPRVCSRIIGLLSENTNALGLRQIDAKGYGEIWRQLYSGGHGRLGKNEISAGCEGKNRITLALVFNLR